MAKILVTGGAGYVGSELVYILSPIHEVTVYDNFMCGADVLFGIDGLDIIYGDIRDTSAVAKAVKGHDVIIHLAATVGYPACDIDPNFASQVNVGGTKNVVRALHQDQLLIFCSSASCYGQQGAYVDEAAELNPLTSYAKDKALAEKFVKEHSNYVIFRPATAYGISRKLRLDLLVNTLLYLALTGGTIDLYEPDFIRPIIHVRDFAAALKWAAEGNVPTNEVYNLVCENLTKQEIAEEICRLTGATFNVIGGKDPDQRSYELISDKLSRVWSGCRYSIEYAWFQLKTRLPLFVNDYKKYTVPYQVERFLGGCQ